MEGKAANRGRVFILGLDGATPQLLFPMARAGRLPHIALLMEQGVWGTLHSTIPPLTAPAWVSFMTGLNPGKHGILTFWNQDITDYSLRLGPLVNSSYFAGRTIWDMLGRRGKRVGVVTVPATYPPWPINGVMVCGALLSGKEAFYPPELAGRFKEGLYLSPLFKKTASKEEIFRRGLALMERRLQVALELWGEEHYDCFMLVLGSIDQTQHTFWPCMDPQGLATPSERRRFGQAIQIFYEKADWAVGRIMETLRPQDTLIIMSDHGAGLYPPYSFHTNLWLIRRGFMSLDHRKLVRNNSIRRAIGWLRRLLPRKAYLLFKAWSERRLPSGMMSALHQGYMNMGAVDWSRTKAFRFPIYPNVEGIVINLRGRQPQGIVSPEEYEEVREAIIKGLKEAINQEKGEPVFQNVYRREELYQGPHVDAFPDIIAVLNPEYRGDKELDGPLITPTPVGERKRFGGIHRLYGVFLASGPALRKGERIKGAHILDLAPTILYLMGIPIPRSMDGRVLTQALLPQHLAQVPLVYSAEESVSEVLPSALPPEEEAEIQERLRSLGYLE